MTQANDFPPQQEQPFLSHLIELRDRLLRVVLAVIVVFLCLFPFANKLYHFVAAPLLRQAGGNMIAIDVASPFLTPFKLSLVMAIFVAVPYILYQLWAFVAPALYKTEKRLVFPLLVSSTVLFYMGMTFAYYVVFPLVFGFLTTTAPEGVEVMTDISRYLDFVLKMFFAFGVAFEVPVATIIIIWTGMTTAEALAAKRPYIIVAAFVIGMLLTPPDVISQTLLALPMWALFEIGLVMSKLYTKKPEEASAVDPVAAPERNKPPVDRAAETPMAKPPVTTAEADEPYQEMTEAEMDAELDRIEAEDEWLAHDNVDQEQHPEFEPFPDDDDITPPGSTDNKP